MDVITVVNAQSEGVSRLETEEETFDFEATFHAEYARIARVIARLVQDPARAEELAVETFWKLLQKPGAQGPQVGGWLYRTAVRMGLDELRRRKRQVRYEGEEIFTDGERLERVQTVLSRLSERDAGLLLGLGDGWSYQEMASGLDLNPASVGTFLRRAKDAFRKEYVKRYGRESE
jgi:RNA polymerase sigma-70 factor (ECF subfamily)